MILYRFTFYNRKLKRLIAIDLKLVNLKQSTKDKMELLFEIFEKHEKR